MKRQADKGRSERSFAVDDMVFLKLQPYVQSSLARHSCNKLSFRFFGPFKSFSALAPWPINWLCLRQPPFMMSSMSRSSKGPLVISRFHPLCHLTSSCFRFHFVCCSVAGVKVIDLGSRVSSSGPTRHLSSPPGSRFCLFASNSLGHRHGSMPVLKRWGMSAARPHR